MLDVDGDGLADFAGPSLQGQIFTYTQPGLYFPTGYMTMRLNNGYLPPGRERERVRRFVRKDTTHALEPFRGTPDELLEQLRKVRGLPGSDEQILRFRDAYLNRLMLISAERHKFPLDQRRFEGFFWHVDRELRFLEEGRR